MAEEAEVKEVSEEEDSSPRTIETLRARNQERLRKFHRRARTKGTGYHCPNYPVFDEKMEGLESGLFMFAGESNHGKSAFVLSLAWDYMANPDNHLYLVYVTLDDTADDIFPRVIGMNKDIPISVASKPLMYEQKRDEGDSECALYDELLNKGEQGYQDLLDLGEKFTLLDGNDISCGKDILDKCKDIKAMIRTEDRQANILLVIDSLMDIDWGSEHHFKDDKQLNDFTAKTVKKWAVEILDCPVFGVLHLRKIEQNRRPTIADVKESGRYAYEASFLGLIYNDVARNKQSAQIHTEDEQGNMIPVIELDWSKNKKSAFKGVTYQTFITNHSLVKECPKEVMERFNHIIYT